MKKLLLLSISIIFIACENDEKIIDPVYEFAAIKGNQTANLNEFSNSEVGYPVLVQLWAAQPYAQDIDLTFQATGTNATSGTDFLLSTTTLKIKSGKLVSDTLWIKTIDNEEVSTLPRKVEVKLLSTSQPNIKVGLGITNPANTSILFTIVDDECTTPLSIFNGTLTNAINWGGDDVLKAATSVLSGSQLTLIGNLIDYGAFPNAKVVLTLTPAFSGATRGTATFGEYLAGTDNDGYEYKFVQTGTGRFDVCAETVSIAYDIYYKDGSAWVYWYSVTNVFSV
ncbi:MAG: hypothetical protein J0L66_18635 [Cytophagales bacterium]|nr:hypothetical protein [Cytophagales bacterium]